MTDAPAPDPLVQLANVLDQAHADREADLVRLGDMGDDELAYLAAVDELPDPATDGLETDRCP